MNVLALELSSGEGSIAWIDGGEPDAKTFANDRKHSGLFFEALRELLQTCGRPERIVVGIGPGSYAGTRIAISAAIGLQAAFDCELIGVPSICAMPENRAEYWVIGDARRQTFYSAQILNRRCVAGPTLCTEAELRSRLAAVTSPIFATEPIAAFPDALVRHPSAAILAHLALDERTDATREPLEPLYLRDPHITQPKSTSAFAPAR